MHAIIETGGKQFKVSEGDTLFIEKRKQGHRQPYTKVTIGKISV